MLSRTTRASLFRLQRSAAPAANNSSSRPRVVALQQLQTPSHFIQQKNKASSPCRNFHSTPAVHKGITPDSSDPKPPNPQPTNGNYVVEATPLSDKDYHEVSEHYLEVLLAEVERVQEDGSDVEAEYSAGVLNIIVPGVGTYVLNKQPPNHQIWLSSPISGPKRYDWVLQGDKMYEKQDTRGFINGQWIYLRDGSNLTDLLNDELTLSLPEDLYSVQED
ncbi:hypothetical protein UA08_04781 [Talaromyces atroroseus]|uniref:ferroxidase n=1 Tax=Talaromyces atroroseus TaxID=1441469 RepID=A0A225AFA6_TALAT|nr:hypothetical protein UA08_04781 [Talaromyces atroroseus]OKL59991.1 hypothetical protein UA08_04781 [Talaromyces atroroseus]